jgi:hypothetical protein
LAGDDQEGLQLVRDAGFGEIQFHLAHQVFVAIEIVRGDGAVNSLAAEAIIL